jgi:hypothetical protein
MKRAFLFGLGSSLILIVIAGIAWAFQGVIVGAIMIVICAPLSVLVIRKANAAPPNKSRLHAIGGWLIGFFIIDGVIGAIALAIYLIDLPIGCGSSDCR